MGAEYLILGAFALAFASIGFLDFFDDEPEDWEGENLEFDGGAELFGTDASDSFFADEPHGLAELNVELRGGDDVAEINGVGDISIFGGDGDDTLSSTDGTFSSVLDGGAGDDVLNVTGSGTLSGGAGDDQITLLSTEPVSDTAGGSIDGGDGDDTILLQGGTGFDEFSASALGLGELDEVAGGDGADDFRIELDLLSSEADEAAFGQSLANTEYDDPFGGGTTLESSTPRIDDFDPSEDTISIDVSNEHDSENRGIADVTLTQTELESGAFRSVVSISFDATAGGLTAVSTTLINSNAAFGLEEITITGP